MNDRVFLILVLVLLGIGWGLTTPLAKLAVSEGYLSFGLIFWQFTIGVVVLGAVSVLRRKLPVFGWPQVRLYIIIALLGTVLPNSASFEALRHLPAGVVVILLSLMPLFAFPIALALGNDRFSAPRLIGLCFGFVGVYVLVVPEASLPDPATLVFIPLALIAPLFYALEGNVVGKWGTYGCDPVQVLLGASIVGMVIALPMAVFSGQWIDPRPPWGLPDAALVTSAVIHAATYTTYVWLVGRAGSVFAAQTSYLVTAFGIVWAVLIFSESYSSWIWASLALIFIGLFLVQPRRSETPLDAAPLVGEDTA